ncbi:glycosyltransferase family 4 protein [Frankia sp. R43]|uniref:glycosyltransferase family 4 protein n=1 Tax=Frankia sp. R43 TaxID=269536 RepID=UPI0006CA19F2|nr:glycosyltransferase family 4 protein [Frankia sp. R43]
MRTPEGTSRNGSTDPTAPRLGVLATHLIQYQVPLYRQIAGRQRVRLEVGFLSAAGARSYLDKEFGLNITWDIDLLDGYPHRFLNEGQGGRGNAGTIARNLCSWIREQDVVVIHGHSSPWMLTGSVLARASGRPYLLRGEARPHCSAGGWKARLRDAVAGASVRHCAAGLAIGELNAAFYERFSAARQFFAPYSVDNDRFSAAAATSRPGRAARLAELGLPTDRPVVLFSGKLQEWKRPLDVVSAVRSMGDRVALIIMGDGPLRAEVEQACQGLPAACVGFVNQSQIPAVYSLGDILVLPSSHEPWGLVVNEAMACGLLPVVSDSVGCGPDLVRGLGRVFRTSDVTDLVTALTAAVDSLTDPGLPARIRERVDRYSITATARGYEAAAIDVAAARMSRQPANA